MTSRFCVVGDTEIETEQRRRVFIVATLMLHAKQTKACLQCPSRSSVGIRRPIGRERGCGNAGERQNRAERQTENRSP